MSEERGCQAEEGQVPGGSGNSERPVQLERRGRESSRRPGGRYGGGSALSGFAALYSDEVGLRRKGSELKGTDLAGGDKRVQLGGCNDNPGEEGLWPGPG